MNVPRVKDHEGKDGPIPLPGVPTELGWHHFDGGIYTAGEPTGSTTLSIRY